MSGRVYLDWNASAPLRSEARAAAHAALELAGNPSSVHGDGRAARRVIEEAREAVAALVNADPRNVVFTSGGTEANALALSPGIERGNDKAKRDRLLVSAIEHPSVLAGGRFPTSQVEKIPVDAKWRDRPCGAGTASRRGWPRARVGDGREQRNRRGSADDAGRRDRPPPRRFVARRCRAGGGTDRTGHSGARRRRHDAECAQDRRRKGRRCAHPARRGAAFRRAPHQGRRAGARQPRRHRECRGNRCVRRGRNCDQESFQRRSRTHDGAARPPRSGPACRDAGRRDLRSSRPSACRIRRWFRCPAPRPKRW